MTYRPENQYRCTIIRGKSQSDLENLLPVYVSMVHSQCPCPEDRFRQGCNRALSRVLFHTDDYDSMPDSNQKTVDNHYTEVAGKLLGLYYISNDGYAFETELCQQLAETNDNSLFFKNLCYNFQFPNGAKKSNFIIDDLNHNIAIKPYCFVIALLAVAQQRAGAQRLTKQEIGYYVLNNLDVLQGGVSCQEVYERIMSDRANGIRRAKLQGSHDWQHIKEQFNMLELTGMVETDAEYIWLNSDEKEAIAIFSESTTPVFNVARYRTPMGRITPSLTADWVRYYGSRNQQLENASAQRTMSDVVLVDGTTQTVNRGAVGQSTVELGDQGEALVYSIERDRVSHYKNARFVNKVLLLGKVKGLGYDITSIEADENPARPEFARYIEVKSGNRYTEPDLNSTDWVATLNLSAKEWTAAEQYGEYYNIYIVYYIVKTKRVLVVRMKNPYDLYKAGRIEVYATAYRMSYDSSVLEKRYDGAQS